MPALTVRIDDRLHGDMKLVAALKGMTMNELYKEAMMRLVEAHNVSALRKACDVARTKKKGAKGGEQ
ncbi:MAG: hypothetical protein HQM09_15155 [Candidatus Riflebacteria bacterium]|nr:hypothetical protein [Candidatus Riflebacteria bacterium]